MRFLTVWRQMAGTALQEQQERFASRRAHAWMAWQPLRVLTCWVVPAEGTVRGGVPVITLRFGTSSRQMAGIQRQEQRLGFGFEAGCQVAAPPCASLSGWFRSVVVPGRLFLW
jgi:hypothetical protein